MATMSSAGELLQVVECSGEVDGDSASRTLVGRSTQAGHGGCLQAACLQREQAGQVDDRRGPMCLDVDPAPMLPAQLAQEPGCRPAPQPPFWQHWARDEPSNGAIVRPERGSSYGSPFRSGSL